MGARFGRPLKGHPKGPALPVSAGPRAPVKPTSAHIQSTTSSRAQTAWKAATGQTVEKSVDTGTEMVTKDNAAKFQ